MESFDDIEKFSRDQMESSFNDIEKLSRILRMDDFDSDTTSIDSKDLMIDCELYDVLKDSDNRLIKKCKDPLLKQALICNIRKRKILQQIVDKLEEHLATVKQYSQDYRVKIANDPKPNRKLVQIKKRLGAPYFKDLNMFPSPANQDFLEMEKKEQVNINNVTHIIWTKEDRNTLTTGVIIEICKYKVVEMTKQIQNADNPKLKTKLQREIKIYSNFQHIKKLCQDIEKFKEEAKIIMDTVCNWDKKIDWLEVSSLYFSGRHTDNECKAMWNCYANPKYSKASWKTTENKHLSELCEKYNYQNWEAIASELNTDRSAYQCCVHFHSKICDKFNRDKWTPEEDFYLQSVIDECSTGKYIPWGKVAYYFKHRTKIQIYRHYMNCMTFKIKKGAFSMAEDVLLLVAMKFFKNNTLRVRRLFPHRLLSQLRNRLNTLNTDPTRPWTSEEDTRIIAWVTEHGTKNWKALTAEIPRSDGCIRHRYRIIKKFFDLHPGSSIFDIPRRKSIIRSQYKSRRRLLKKVVNFVLQKLETTDKKSSILNIKYIAKISETFIKEGDADSGKKDGPVRGRPVRKNTINIDSLIDEFFQSSTKSVVRKVEKEMDHETIDNTTKRVELLLDTLGANLEFPSLDEIKNNPMLDDTDKQIITKMIKNKQNLSNPGVSKRQNSYKKNNILPPNIENLTGFRGILLHMPILKLHSLSKYTGYPLYVRTGRHASYPKQSFFCTKQQVDDCFRDRDQLTPNLALEERNLLQKRLHQLFQWPAVLAETILEPEVEPQIQEEVREHLKEKQKCGRKSRNERHRKIKLMNEARRNSCAKKRACKEDLDEPGPSKKKPKLN